MRMAEGRWEGAGEDRMAGGWWVVGGGLWWVLWRVGNVVLESCERGRRRLRARSCGGRPTGAVVWTASHQTIGGVLWLWTPVWLSHAGAKCGSAAAGLSAGGVSSDGCAFSMLVMECKCTARME